MASSDEQPERETVNALKNSGNALFQDGKFSEALAQYERALEVATRSIDVPARRGDAAAQSTETTPAHDVTMLAVAVLFSNISACHMEMKLFDFALTDADSAIRMAPKWCKGYWRRARALHALGDKKRALESLEHALVLEPANVPVRELIAELKRDMPSKVGRSESGPIMAVEVRNHLQMSLVRRPPLDQHQLFYPPLLRALGIPIALAYAPNSQRRGDNQFATYCTIEAAGGFAPEQWQSGRVGDVLIMWTTERSMTKAEAFALWDYFSVTLDAFGNAEPPTLDRQQFLDWQESYNHLAAQVRDPDMQEMSFLSPES